MQYRSEIDGLRALAVVPVILFHFNISAFEGGFVGVDIFFVISGYLITGLILTEVRENRFTFYNFYERRARRLAPAAFTVLLFSCISAWFILLTPEDMAAFGKSLWASILFSSNIIFMKEAGYFDLPSQVKPLLHTWSLAVEEQFYIVFPVIALTIFRYCKNQLKPLLLILFAISFAISVITLKQNPAFSFYMLPSRAWELLLGALLAAGLMPAPKQGLPQNLAGAVGLGLILYSLAFYTKTTPFPGIAALPPCLGTAMIIWANTNSKCMVGNMLSWRPFVFVGLISYPLYLWHWPLTVFTKYQLDRNLLGYEIIVLIAIIFTLSYLTWRLIEQPVRKRNVVLKQPAAIFAASMIGGVLFISFGQVAQQTKGLAIRLPEEARQYARGAWDKNPDTKKCHGIPAEEIKRFRLCILGQKTDNTPDFIVWGDSHANVLMPMLKKLATQKQLYGVQATFSACRPLIAPPRNSSQKQTGCTRFNQAMLEIIKEKNIQNVILAGAWPIKPDQELHSSIRHTISQLKNRNVWVFTDVPHNSKRVPSALARAVIDKKNPDKIGVPVAKYKIAHNKIKEVFENNSIPPVHFIDASGILCGNRTHCLVQSNGKALYYDQGHLTTYGALFISTPFEEALESIKNAKNKLALKQ